MRGLSEAKVSKRLTGHREGEEPFLGEWIV